jgi:hypothetical protein
MMKVCSMATRIWERVLGRAEAIDCGMRKERRWVCERDAGALPCFLWDGEMECSLVEREKRV